MTTSASPVAALEKEVWAYRAALLNARAHLTGPARHFPADPAAATELLARHLRQAGHPDVRLCEVSRAGEGTFTWVQVGDLHVDWTVPAAQGGAVSVTRSHPNRVYRTLGTAVEVSESPSEALAADERAVAAVLAQVNPDVRTQPLVPVVDTWEGHEVLACGHLMPPGVYARNARRRCRYCPPGPVARTFRATGDAAALDWFAGLSDAQRGSLIQGWRAVQVTDMVGSESALQEPAQ